MPLKPDQLRAHLDKKLAPIYLVGGSEVLLVGECLDAIRGAARARGFTGRKVFEAERSFDWSDLAREGMAQSLFAERRLIELRLPQGKAGTAGARAIQAWSSAPAPDTVLVISAMDAELRDLNKAKWVKAVERAGVYVPVYPIEHERLPQWIHQRMRQAGLEATPEAIALLAERVQGNLLAAQQEIDKLTLLADGARIDEEMIAHSVADNARFEAFGMIDAALAGHGLQAVRALRGLQGEGIELVQITGALLWQLRQLSSLSFQARNAGLDAAMRAVRTWPKKRQLLEQSLRRHPLADWFVMLDQCKTIDRQIKGRSRGDPWEGTEQLLLELAA